MAYGLPERGKTDGMKKDHEQASLPGLPRKPTTTVSLSKKAQEVNIFAELRFLHVSVSLQL